MCSCCVTAHASTLCHRHRSADPNLNIKYLRRIETLSSICIERSKTHSNTSRTFLRSLLFRIGLMMCGVACVSECACCRVHVRWKCTSIRTSTRSQSISKWIAFPLYQSECFVTDLHSINCRRYRRSYWLGDARMLWMPHGNGGNGWCAVAASVALLPLPPTILCPLHRRAPRRTPWLLPLSLLILSFPLHRASAIPVQCGLTVVDSVRWTPRLCISILLCSLLRCNATMILSILLELWMRRAGTSSVRSRARAQKEKKKHIRNYKITLALVSVGNSNRLVDQR